MLCLSIWGARRLHALIMYYSTSTSKYKKRGGEACLFSNGPPGPCDVADSGREISASMPLHRNVPLADPNEMEESLRQFRSEGFRRFQLKLGRSVEEDIDLVRTFHRPQAMNMIDTHSKPTLPDRLAGDPRSPRGNVKRGAAPYAGSSNALAPHHCSNSLLRPG